MENKVIAVIVVILLIALVVWRWPRGHTDIFRERLYFDNNGTTRPHDSVISAVTNGMRLGNASSAYASEARDIIHNTKDRVGKWILDSSDDETKKYDIVFTSGASESNNLIIRSMVDKWHLDFLETSAGKALGNENSKAHKPHIILSTIEHKTSLECVRDLVQLGRVDATFIGSGTNGRVPPDAVASALRPSTILVTVMHANNETGAINDIRSISSICKNAGVPFHTDAVQTFGKYPIPMQKWGIDALSMSFHKMYGPAGLGLLIITRSLSRDPNFRAQISGSQNSGLRGGTENIPALAGAGEALKITLADRPKKNTHLLQMKNEIITLLATEYKILQFKDFVGKDDNDMSPVLAVSSGATPRKFGIVFLGATTASGMPCSDQSLPNTLLFSIVTLFNFEGLLGAPTQSQPQKYEHFCNIKLKEALDEAGVAISIGSACNTGASGPSHVIMALGAPFIIRCGVVRISLGDYNTSRDVKKMMKIFHSKVALQAM